MSVKAGFSDRPDPPDADGDPDRSSPQAADDDSLLRGIRAGREAYLEVAFQRYYGRIHGLLARLAGEEADDLVQEVFWRLYTRPPSRPDSDLRAWLYRVASRLGYNALRRRRRLEATVRAAMSAERVGGQAAGADADLDRDDERATVRAALARLRRRDAELLALRYGGLSYAQVAEALGIAAGSVGTLLARAERAFAEQYRQLAEQGGVR